MSDLMMLQHDFQDYILTLNSPIDQSILSTEKVPAATRLGIYSFAYRARLIDALASNYPMLHVFLGDDEFEALGNAYLDQYPSSYRSIRWFGDQLADFVKQYYQQYSYLVELVHIEWVMTLVFDASDAPLATLEVMSHINPEDWSAIHLEFHPAVRVLSLSWDMMPFWQALAEDQTPEEPVQGEAVRWIFWRKELMIQYSPLPEDEAWAFGVMQEGGDFGQLCTGLCRWLSEEDAIMRAASLLKSWISAGLITKVYL